MGGRPSRHGRHRNSHAVLRRKNFKGAHIGAPFLRPFCIVFSPIFALRRFKARGRKTIAFIRWQNGEGRSARRRIICGLKFVFRRRLFCGSFCGGIHLPRAGKAGVKRDARNPAISAGRRKSAVAAGPIAERCQIFSFLFARRPLKSARLVRVFLSPYGLKSRANFKLRTAFGRRRADCPAGEKLSICRFRFPCPPGLFRFCDPDCPSADVFPLIRKVSLWRLRQVKARFAVRRRRTGGALFASFPTIARFRG